MGGQGAIPWTAIDAFAARHGIVQGFERFNALIRRLDGEYLKGSAQRAREAAERVRLEAEEQDPGEENVRRARAKLARSRAAKG